MKAIILSAWEWSRLRPLTYSKPKPLIKIFGKSILEHNMSNIAKYVDEFIIVVRYKKELIKEYLWNEFNGVKISYHEQKSDCPWSWWAVIWIKWIKWSVLILNGDSIFETDDLQTICELKWYWVLVKQVQNPEIYWIFKQDEKWNAISVIEKPTKFVWNLANLWVYKFNYEIFKLVKNIWLSPRWEFEITDAINNFVKKYPTKLIPISWEFIDVWYPWHILQSDKFFLCKMDRNDIDWEIESWVTIKWFVRLWAWSIIKAWTYIEWNLKVWENSIIWPNTYMTWNNIIGNTCHIKWLTKLENTSIWEWVNIGSSSYIWYSIIGNNVIIDEWFITSTHNQNWENIKVMIKWQNIDTWLKNFWCVIWDNSFIWTKIITNPWKMFDNNSRICWNSEMNL